MERDRAAELLAGERRRIEEALVRLAPVDDGELSTAEPADLASDTYDAELDKGIADQLREQLAALERAEKRLAAGTYGLSIRSGAPIPDERLEAYPLAELTVDEAGGGSGTEP